jgi:hypothetical protein
MNKNTLVFLALSLPLSALALWLALRNVPMAELAGYMGSIRYEWAVLSAGLIFVSFILRTLRWQIIVNSVHKIGFSGAFHPLMIGFMLNCILPGRAGEVARPVILQQNSQVPFTTGFATVAAERVFDMAILIMLFAIVLAKVPIDAVPEMTFGQIRLNRQTLEMAAGGMMKLCILAIAAMLLLVFARTRQWITGWILKSPTLLFFLSSSAKEWVERKAARPVVKLMENVASGFSLLKSGRHFAACLALSVLIWIVQGLSFYIFSLGCPGIDITIAQMFTVMVLICFFIAMPSVPGYWGLWEAGGIFALSLFGVLSKDAAGFTLANHALQILPIVIIGLISAVISGVNIMKIRPEKAV